MIFLGAFLTGLGVYDKLGKHAGMGSALPITGFANSIVSPAMEFKQEGWVMGVGARMFTVAGPVIVFAVVTSFVVGVLRFVAGGG
jgi:stage V sporulation protein AC